MEQGEDLLSSESYRHKWLDQVMDLWAQQAVHVIWDRFQGENYIPTRPKPEGTSETVRG